MPPPGDAFPADRPPESHSRNLEEIATDKENPTLGREIAPELTFVDDAYPKTSQIFSSKCPFLA